MALSENLILLLGEKDEIEVAIFRWAEKDRIMCGE